MIARAFGMLGMLAAIGLPPAAVAATTAPAAGLSLELNALQPSETGCRVTFLATNSLGKPLDKAAFEVALFNATGGIERLVTLDFKALPEGKTKVLATQLAKLGFGAKALVIDGDALNVSFALASSNIKGINLLPAVGANVYDILKHDTLVLTRAAVEKLEARLNG